MSRAARATVALSFIGAIGSCNSIDTTRQALPKATLGDDMFGVLCDRVGASSFTEDLTGASYYAICHYDTAGNYQDQVDVSVLPPTRGDVEATARNLSIAKLEAMARRRADLIRAINATFPDVMIDDVVNGSGQVRLHDALMDFTQHLDPLYWSNPIQPEAEPLMPASTRSLGRMFSSIADSQAARDAFAHIWGRQGYRPFQVGLGAVRAALAYPGLRSMTKAQLDVVGPGAPSAGLLQQMLAVAKQELATSAPVDAPLGPVVVDPATGQPNRPRTKLEVLANVLLAEDKSFAANDSDPPLYIAMRDRRGFIVPQGNNPGQPGTVKAPFADVDGDGFADVDAFGRFVDAQGAPLALDPPFAIPGITTGTPDEFGRLGAPYQYLDTSRALTGAMLRHLVPFVDPTQYVQPGPDAYKSEHETLMYAMAGSYFLYGGREPAQYDYQNEAIVGPDDACDGCIQYNRFRAEESPLVDLVHASGQVLADKDSDAILLSMIDLLQNHEDVMARLIGALLKVRDISLKHDEDAAKGAEPFAGLTYETPVWDEMAQIIARITARPGLTQKLLDALAQDDVVTPYGPSKHMGDTTALFATTVDKLTYDRQSGVCPNGPAVNISVGAPSTADPQTPIKPKSPRNGDNISLLQRSLMVIHDANKATACNKNNASVHTNLGFDWPLVGSNYVECELTKFENEAVFFLDSNLPANHPKRSTMQINGALGGILQVASDIGIDPDTLLVPSSGIDGLGLHPESYALTRLLFFGAATDNYPNMPDEDFANEGSQAGTFIHHLIEPVGGSVCPKNANGVNTCATGADTLRIRDGNTMFAWERLGFLEYLKPMINVFANESCDSQGNCVVDDVSGEQIFVDLLDTLWTHWPGKDHGIECENKGTKDTNPKYCSQAGINRYEPLLGDALRTDLIPALHEFALAARDLSKIVVQRGPYAGQTWTASEVMEKLTRILFDPAYAGTVGMVDRKGNKAAKWTDGHPQQQLTPFTLFGDALHAIDVAFDQHCDANDAACKADADMRKGMWHRARSQFVDEHIAVDGEGPGAKFHNRAFPKMMVVILRTLREQLNANCKDRETGTPCAWAKKDIGKNLETVMSGPMFAAMMDVQEAIRADEPARRALETFLQTIMQSATSGDALQGTLASFSDMMQALTDDGNFSAIFNAVANVSSPENDADGPGAADTTVKSLKALTGDDYDRYHVLDYVLPNLVTPMDGTGLSPIEVFMDVIAEVHRVDASVTDPLATDDYHAIMGTMRDFMLDNTRGLEQVYTIIKNRPRE